MVKFAYFNPAMAAQPDRKKSSFGPDPGVLPKAEHRFYALFAKCFTHLAETHAGGKVPGNRLKSAGSLTMPPVCGKVALSPVRNKLTPNPPGSPL